MVRARRVQDTVIRHRRYASSAGLAWRPPPFYAPAKRAIFCSHRQGGDSRKEAVHVVVLPDVFRRSLCVFPAWDAFNLYATRHQGVTGPLAALPVHKERRVITLTMVGKSTGHILGCASQRQRTYPLHKLFQETIEGREVLVPRGVEHLSRIVPFEVAEAAREDCPGGTDRFEVRRRNLSMGLMSRHVDSLRASKSKER
jgi:hypothetical protein